MEQISKDSAISAYQTYPVRNNSNVRQAQINKTRKVNKSTLNINFEGNPKKKPHQFAAFATESNYLGGIYVAGGLGDVAEALPEQMVIHSENIIGKKDALDNQKLKILQRVYIFFQVYD